MASAFVSICDDLTGSGVQSILARERGLFVRLVVDPSLFQGDPGEGVLVVNADTRVKGEEAAARTIRRLLSLLPDGVLVGKRIDTTLRGHLSLETSLFLERFPERRAFVVPAYPASGRTTVGGFQLLGGVPVERTEVSSDPIWPIRESFVPAFFEGLSPSLVSLRDVRRSDLAEVIGERASSSRVLVFDAVSDADVERVAEAALSSGVPFFPVDPGPFTAAVAARALGVGGGGAALAVIGSLSKLTQEQLRFVASRASVAELEVEGLLEEGFSAADWAQRALRLLEGKPQMLVLLSPRTRAEGKANLAAERLAELASKVLEAGRGSFVGLLVSGGDTAASLLRRLGALWIEPVREIAPLVMGGIVRGGAAEGLRIATKGGLVGGEDGLLKALSFLRRG